MIYDSSAVIDALIGRAGRQDVRVLLDEDPAPMLSAVNLAETIIGLTRYTGRPWKPPADFLAIVPVTGPIAVEAAAFYADLRLNGPASKLSLADCMAAATAQELGTRVVATDQDFRHFPAGLAIVVR